MDVHFRIQVVVVADDGTEQRQEITELSRTESRIETIGLTLAENKLLSFRLQQVMVAHQVGVYLRTQRPCLECGRQRQLKEQGPPRSARSSAW